MRLAERIAERLLAADALPPISVLIGVGVLCDQLSEDNAAIENALVEMFQAIFRKIPDAYKLHGAEFSHQWQRWPEERGTVATVPLYDVLTSVGNAINQVMVAVCYNDALLQDSSLYALRKKLFANEASAHGLSLYERRKKKITPVWEMDEPPEKLCDMYLRGTPFLEFFNTQVPFVIPRKTFASHGIILAPPNHGKTQLLGSLISSFLRDTDNRVGCFVLDPHGDLFSTLSVRCDPSRLVLLDPDTSPPPLNFLDFGTSTEAQTLQTFSYLMSSLSGGLSDKQGAIVPYLLKLLRQIPEASLETLRLLVDEKVKNVQHSQFASFILKLPPVDQGFFHSQYYSSRMQETKDAIGWKLYSALSSDAFRQMFSPRNTSEVLQTPSNHASANRGFGLSTYPQSIPQSFDADAAMRDRKVVLVKGARQSLGDDGMTVFLQFIVAQFFAAALRRERVSPDKRKLCLLFVDEAHHVFNSQTANILTECRKYGLGLVAATQVIQQIPEDVKSAIYGATAIKIAGPVSHSDSVLLSREMGQGTTVDFLRSMKAKEASHADWAVYVSGMTEKAVKVRVPYGALEAMPKFKRDLAGGLSPTKTHDHFVDADNMVKTHEAPEKGASHSKVVVVPGKVAPILPQETPSTDDASTPAKGRPF